MKKLTLTDTSDTTKQWNASEKRNAFASRLNEAAENLFCQYSGTEKQMSYFESLIFNQISNCCDCAMNGMPEFVDEMVEILVRCSTDFPDISSAINVMKRIVDIDDYNNQKRR